MELKDFIHSKRPTLASSSITTYASMLRSLYFKLCKSRDIDYEKFNDSVTILEYLKDLPANRRKTILSALYVITNNNDYKTQMIDDVKTYNNQVATQEKTPQQKANWITTAEIEKVYKALSKQANLLYKKEQLTNKDIQEIQDYIIVALLGGIFIPPRRSKDLVDFKIKEIDPNLNYMEKKTMVFNSYKTAKFYGKQVIDIPPPLLKILKKWISINPTSFLLFDSNKNQLTAVKVTQRLNKIFGGKHIAVNSLRHSYLTGKYADTIKINESLSADMDAMGSSMKQSTLYVKR
jgi:integrase